MNIPERKNWIRAISSHSRDDVIILANKLGEQYNIKFTLNPQAGLALLALKDGAFHTPFYLGEIPLSKCCVEIAMPDGRKNIGCAQIMVDDAEYAKALAILDGILDGRLPGWESIAQLVIEGFARCAEIDQRRRCMLAATHVDFSMLNDTKDINDDPAD